MLGFGHVGQYAIGFIQDSITAPVVFEPVSRILAGGFSNTRPAAVAVLGVDLEWDSEDWIGWDDGSDIGWEA